ncbi:MAG: hypothetical protein ABIP78_04960, partial [Pyrinomonadaceae bacterium]
MKIINRIFICLILIVTALIAVTGASAQAPSARKSGGNQISVTYTVELKDPAKKLFHVAATFGNLRKP